MDSSRSRDDKSKSIFAAFLDEADKENTTLMVVDVMNDAENLIIGDSDPKAVTLMNLKWTIMP